MTEEIGPAAGSVKAFAKIGICRSGNAAFQLSKKLAQSCTQFLNVQNSQGNGQTALTQEYKRNWESRDKALDQSACERLKEHAELGRVIEQLKDSWKKK